MRTLQVRGASAPSTVAIGETAAALGRYVGDGRCVYVTDANVAALYPQLFEGREVFVMQPGEAHKTLDTVEAVYERLLDRGVDRSTTVVGIGGGIGCDVAGFVAATYLRGLRCGFVASSLLAQVDASVGGKNGVNLHGYKNLVGVIRQPEFVLCDLSMLRTLPPRELRCGLAEVVKAGAIANAGLVDFLEANAEGILGLDLAALEHCVGEAVGVKARVVEVDEHETGERMKLNFGHTVGHAIEKTLGLPHGEAVAVGMVLAARLSVKRGMLAPAEASRLENLLARRGLPTSAPMDRQAILEAMGKDKKRRGDKVRFVLLEKLGQAALVPLGLEELEAVL